MIRVAINGSQKSEIFGTPNDSYNSLKLINEVRLW